MGKSLRTYLDQLKKERPNELKVINREVDPIDEISGLTEKLQQQGQFPALLFNNVKGSKLPVLINLHASFERLALAEGAKDLLDMEINQAERENKPQEPVYVDRESAPVREVILCDKDADLGLFPFTHKNELDAGRYISAGVTIMRDKSGQINMGMYRHQIQGPHQLGIMINPANQGSHILRDYEEAGEPCPVAIAIGHHPCFYMAGVAKVPPGEEIRLAGSLMDEPLEVIKGETVDLPVPANAEIVIEGYVHPGERHQEGTFGEWPGYYNKEGPCTFVKVTAITMRKDAICEDLLAAHPEHNILGAVPRMGSLYRGLRAVLPNVKAVNLPWSGGCRSFCYISMKKRAEGEPTQAAFAAMAIEPNIKHTVIVDDDIDAFNETEVLWAMAMRFQGDRDLKIIPNALGSHLNPSAYGHDRLAWGVMETKLIFDCTKPLPPFKFAERARVKADVVDRINPEEYLEDWK
ncbi:MAG: UbiD family decarboxylase [Chloroflexi bacterium]|nr:MAG: UbiD family decarboxylase [Chloroflexota bacterium]